MKPFRIFVFFAVVICLLLALGMVFPSGGLRLPGGIRLQFFSPAGLFEKDSLPPVADFDHLIAVSGLSDDPEEGADQLLPPFDEADSFSAQPDSILVAGLNADSLRATLQRIEFSPDAPDLLVPFFRQLSLLLTDPAARARVLHYGDSQIENDRMTALIRHRLQKRFGGTGTGLIPAVPLYSGNLAYSQEISGDWRRFTFFGNRDSSVKHRSYGSMGAFALVPASEGEQWPQLSFRFNTRRRTGQVERVRLFMHSFADGARLAFSANDSLCDTLGPLPAGYAVTEFDPGQRLHKLALSAGFPEGGRIYALSFESAAGVQVDNIAMRGSSGLLFSKLNRQQLHEMMASLSPTLLLLQYGGNAVPYIDAAFYERTFKRELRSIQGLCPGVAVIVIGPSDMSIREKGRFVSHPNLVPVRDALRRAALESGVAFWDLYEAMGGRDVMPSFVAADPPLASTDYIHFTPLGANLMAGMFYQALILEYDEWERGLP